MSFTRIKYDNEAYNLKLNRTTNDYRLFMDMNENCNTCLSYDGPRNAKSTVSIVACDSNNIWPHMTDIESKLTNRNNILIDYNAYGKNDIYKNTPVRNKIVCDNKLISEDTRFSFPIEAFRCMDLTQYHYTPFLHVNSQCEIQDSLSRSSTNSRLVVKDSYDVIKPKVVEQTNILPSESLESEYNICKTI